MERMRTKELMDLAIYIMHNEVPLRDYERGGISEIKAVDLEEVRSIITRIENLKTHALSAGFQIDMSRMSYAMQSPRLLVG